MVNKIWDKLLQMNVNNKEKYQKIFSEIVEKVKNDNFPLLVGHIEKEHYYLVVEEKAGSYFIHIVPKQAYNLFKEMQENIPNAFLGFSALSGR